MRDLLPACRFRPRCLIWPQCLVWPHCLVWTALLWVVCLAACGKDESPVASVRVRGPESDPPAYVVRPTPDGALRIAAIFPTSGRFEASGRESFIGVRMAVESINRAGGVRGRRIFLVEYPTRSDLESTGEAARRAAGEGALALLGSNASLFSSAVAEVAQAHGVVMVSNVSTATALTIGRPYVFRACYSNDRLASLLARFVWDDLGARRVAVLEEVARPYSKDLGDRFEEHFARRIGHAAQDRAPSPDRPPPAVRVWQYVAMEPDFTPYLDQVRAFRAEVIFLPSSFDDATVFAIQLAALDLDLTLVGGDSWSNAKLFARGGPRGPAYHSDHWNPAADNPFLARFRARFGRDPQGGRAALAHDAVQAVAEAVRHLDPPLGDTDLNAAGLPTTRRRLRTSLARVELAGATGPLVFDAEGNAQRPCFVFKMEGMRRTLATVMR